MIVLVVDYCFVGVYLYVYFNAGFSAFYNLHFLFSFYFCRASSRTADDSAASGPGMTPEKLRNMTIEHAGDNHHVNPWDSGFGAGFFGGGLNGGGGGRGRGGRAEAAAQAKSRLVTKNVAAIFEGISRQLGTGAGV